MEKERPFDPNNDDPFLNSVERKVVKRLLSHPEDFPNEFWRSVIQKVALDGESIPQSQVLGLSSFSVFADYVPSEAGETTSSITFTNLTTAGPSLSGLRSGLYLVLYGAQTTLSSGAADHAVFSPSINGAAASETDAAIAYSPVAQAHYTPMTARVKTLTESSNSLIMKYRTAGGSTMQWIRRWMIAIRYGNG